MTPEQLLAVDRAHIWHPFTQELTAPPPVPIARAAGAVLYGHDGTEYLDLIASWWVVTHGHAHPDLARAVAEQAGRMEQVIFAGFTHEPAVRLVAGLLERLPPGLSRVFFSDNGSSAVEVALKGAYQYWCNRGEPRGRFLALEGGYHGDTFGAMAAGRSTGFFDRFAPLLFGVDWIPFPATWEGDDTVEEREEQALATARRLLAEHPGQYAALIAEPLVQGAGGMRMCRPRFLRQLATELRAAGVLLIWDEVMTGFGRTGSFFACEQVGVVPDFMCLAKGLSGGFLPLAATVASEGIYRQFLGPEFATALAHGHSFTANPIGCAAGVVSLELFTREHTLERIAAIADINAQRLARIATHPLVRRPRRLGVIAAFEVEVSDPGYSSRVGPWLKGYFLARGLLLRPLGNVVYILPPYCITPRQLHHAWDGIDSALAELAGW